MMSYEKLEVYQLSMDILGVAMKISSQLPPGYSDLVDQLKRAAMSTPQNIGEGAGKRTPADCRKYFDNARGSAMECGVHFDICATCAATDPVLIKQGKDKLERLVAMLTRLSQSQSLRTSRRTGSR